VAGRPCGVGGGEGVIDRLELELEVIEKTGFVSYFLIVGDFVRYGRSKGIACVARGSAPGRS
jgi:DNA polymerase III subunit alpha